MAASDTSPGSVTLPGSTQPQAVAAFINKVWSILSNEEYKKLISWSECGKNVIVHDYPNFSKDILPHYFKHNNFNSFVRQLNLYGFRKVSHPELGVLSKVQVSEPVEFWHPNFRRGHPELLYLVQRRPVSNRIGPEEKKPELNKVLSDIHAMKGKQENIGDMLEAMKQDNDHLKRELELLRARHSRQQRVLNKIIQFLIHMVYKGRLPSSGRRRPDSRYLMLTDSEGAAPPAKRGRVSFDPSPSTITYADSPLSISDLAEVCELPIKAAPDVAAIDSVPPSLPFPTITSPPSLPFPTITSPPTSPSTNPLIENTPTSTQYALEAAPPPSLLPPAGTTLSGTFISSPSSVASAATAATTNALATITTSLPLPSSSSSSSSSSSPLVTSLLPAIQESNSQTGPSPSTGAIAEFSSPTVYPEWGDLSGHLDSHQQELDLLPDFLSNQLSFDPSVLNQFINFGDVTAPDYDALDTARLLETLSQEDDGETAIFRELSPHTALVPIAASGASISTSGGESTSHPTALDEEDDEQSSSLRELLELNKDT